MEKVCPSAGTEAAQQSALGKPATGQMPPPTAGPASAAAAAPAAEVSAAAAAAGTAVAPAPPPKTQLSPAAEQVLLAFFSLQDSLTKDEARMLAQRVRDMALTTICCS